MFFHFSIFFYSLLFFFGLEMMQINSSVAFPMGIVLALVSLRASKVFGKSWRDSIVPLILIISSTSLLYLIDSAAQKQLFIGIAFAVYYISIFGAHRLVLYPKDQTARGLMAFSSMTALFVFYSSCYGLYLNFSIPLWTFMLVYGIVTSIVSLVYLSVLEIRNTRLVYLYSSLLGLSMAEISWIINFWPFGYLTTSVIVLIFYYILWDLTQSYFLNILSQRRVAGHLTLLSFLIAMILMSSRWLPIV